MSTPPGETCSSHPSSALTSRLSAASRIPPTPKINRLARRTRRNPRTSVQPRHGSLERPRSLRSPYAPKTARAPLLRQPSVAAGPPRARTLPRPRRSRAGMTRSATSQSGTPTRPPSGTLFPPRIGVRPMSMGLVCAPMTGPARGAFLRRRCSASRSPRSSAGSGIAPRRAPRAPGSSAATRRARRQPAERPAARRGDEIMSELDLERLEASLRWLQRQETATRLSRGAHPLRQATLAPHAPHPPRAGAERSGELHRSPLSLEPQRLAPPRSSRAAKICAGRCAS